MLVRGPSPRRSHSPHWQTTGNTTRRGPGWSGPGTFSRISPTSASSRGKHGDSGAWAGRGGSLSRKARRPWPGSWPRGHRPTDRPPDRPTASAAGRERPDAARGKYMMGRYAIGVIHARHARHATCHPKGAAAGSAVSHSLCAVPFGRSCADDAADPQPQIMDDTPRGGLSCTTRSGMSSLLTHRAAACLHFPHAAKRRV